MQGSIRSALIKVHWRRFSIVALLEVGCSFGLLLNPFVLQQLLLELEHGARTGTATAEDLSACFPCFDDLGPSMQSLRSRKPSHFLADQHSCFGSASGRVHKCI